MTSIILMTNFLRTITENMRQFSGILRTPIHSLLSSFTCKTTVRTPEIGTSEGVQRLSGDNLLSQDNVRTPDGIRIVSKDHTYKQSVASHPEFFAQYAVGISVYNKYRPQETYVIAQLFIVSDATEEGPYISALLTTNQKGSPWLRHGAMRMVKLASADEQLFVPFSVDNYTINYIIDNIIEI